MKRFVLDTDAVVAGMRSPSGASAALLARARSRSVTLLVSVPLALEYEAVCLRDTHRSASGLTRDEAQLFADAVIAMAEPVPIYFLWRPQLRDAGDELVLEAAVNGRADAIVGFNRKDYGTVPERFGIRFLLPAEMIRTLA